MGSLAQEVSGEALPLPSSLLSRTFSFSSAPETTYTGWALEPAVGDMGSAQILEQNLGRREVTEVRQEVVKRGRRQTSRA